VPLGEPDRDTASRELEAGHVDRDRGVKRPVGAVQVEAQHQRGRTAPYPGVVIHLADQRPHLRRIRGTDE
jgi:hypothetical protein